MQSPICGMISKGTTVYCDLEAQGEWTKVKALSKSGWALR